MRRPTVLSLPLQLVFSGHWRKLTYAWWRGWESISRLNMFNVYDDVVAAAVAAVAAAVAAAAAAAVVVVVVVQSLSSLLPFVEEKKDLFPSFLSNGLCDKTIYSRKEYRIA